MLHAHAVTDLALCSELHVIDDRDKIARANITPAEAAGAVLDDRHAADLRVVRVSPHCIEECCLDIARERILG